MRLVVGAVAFIFLASLSLALDCSAIGRNGTVYSDTILSEDISSSQDCLSIGAGNITLDCANHALAGEGTGTGINILGRQGVTVKNCFIRGFSYGIRASYSSLISLEADEARGNYLGFYLLSSSQVFLKGVAALNNSEGIYAYDLFGSEIRKSSSRENSGHGLEIRSSASNSISNNDFSSNKIGIGVYSSSAMDITENDLRGNYLGYTEEGVRDIRSSGNSVDILSGDATSRLLKGAGGFIMVVLGILALGALIYVFGMVKKSTR